MKLRLLDLVVCPLDGQPLELLRFETHSRPLDAAQTARAERLDIRVGSLETVVVTGLLLNPRKKIAYPILDGVPRLLVFQTGVHEEFTKRFGERMAREAEGYTFPSETGAPGERDVLRTFSSEWTGYGWDGSSYWNLKPDTWFECMKYMLGTEEHPLDHKRVLEVGIGVGATADHLAKTYDTEMVGVDLSYAVDAAYRHFGDNPFLHIVQSSVFAPPFPAESFDFVYSFGVIHHTYSTRDAFKRLSPLPKHGGRLFIWVYSPSNENRNLKRRTIMALEKVVRPIVWKLEGPAQTAALLPFVPLYIGHQLARRLRHGSDQVVYGVREAMHAARDRFSPRYIHRHTDDEVSQWFEEEGYRAMESASRKPRPAFVPEAFTVSTGVTGTRA